MVQGRTLITFLPKTHVKLRSIEECKKYKNALIELMETNTSLAEFWDIPGDKKEER
jgi:hypothetical protein